MYFVLSAGELFAGGPSSTNGVSPHALLSPRVAGLLKSVYTHGLAGALHLWAVSTLREPP